MEKGKQGRRLPPPPVTPGDLQALWRGAVGGLPPPVGRVGAAKEECPHRRAGREEVPS